jgi:hypothetical protein
VARKGREYEEERGKRREEEKEGRRKGKEGKGSESEESEREGREPESEESERDVLRCSNLSKESSEEREQEWEWSDKEVEGRKRRGKGEKGEKRPTLVESSESEDEEEVNQFWDWDGDGNNREEQQEEARDSDDEYSIASQLDEETRRRTEAKGYDIYEVKIDKKKMGREKLWEYVKRKGETKIDKEERRKIKNKKKEENKKNGNKKVERKKIENGRKKEEKKEKDINKFNRRIRGREADEMVKKARNKMDREIEVIIDESSDEELDEELCVRVILKDETMTERLLYSLIGNEVPTKAKHPRHYVSVKRGHGVLALYKKAAATRLLQFRSEFVKFEKYEHVKGENDYITIKIVGEFGEITEKELRRELERVLREVTIGGWFAAMKEGVAYVDFQTDRVLDRMERYPYIRIKGRYLNLERIELKTEDPQKLVFFRGLSVRISKEKFRRGLGKAGIKKIKKKRRDRKKERRKEGKGKKGRERGKKKEKSRNKEEKRKKKQKENKNDNRQIQELVQTEFNFWRQRQQESRQGKVYSLLEQWRKQGRLWRCQEGLEWERKVKCYFQNICQGKRERIEGSKQDHRTTLIRFGEKCTQGEKRWLTRSGRSWWTVGQETCRELCTEEKEEVKEEEKEAVKEDGEVGVTEDRIGEEQRDTKGQREECQVCVQETETHQNNP